MKLLSAEFFPLAAIRRYQHPTLGVLHVQTFYGKDGSADIVQLHAAVLQARLRLRNVGGRGHVVPAAGSASVRPSEAKATSVPAAPP